MQINNILDFDDEASAKAYNFTITAIKEFYDTIETSLDKGTQRKTTENELPSLTQCTA